jgi:hypothetical protein
LVAASFESANAGAAHVNAIAQNINAVFMITSPVKEPAAILARSARVGNQSSS